MDRKNFLRNSLGLLGASLIVPKTVTSCTTNTVVEDTEAGNCSVWNSETEGPFPTKEPDSFLRKDIKGDRTGIDAKINIKVKNIDANCQPIKDVMVDIWHCDKDGNYSQYGDMFMQPTDYRTYNFLRGRQITDANGDVAFNSIFPGWYNGRATHIHVHIYDKSGKSLKVTQIAFPEGDNSVVAQVNAAKQFGYTKNLVGYTYNAQDNVFFDDKEGHQIATVSGSIDKGFTIDATIIISTENIEEFKDDFMGGPGGPGDRPEGMPGGFPPGGMPPMQTKFNFKTDKPTRVVVKVFDLKGDLVKTVIDQNYQAGEFDLDFTKFGLDKGPYHYTLDKIINNDTITESNRFFIP